MGYAIFHLNMMVEHFFTGRVVHYWLSEGHDLIPTLSICSYNHEHYFVRSINRFQYGSSFNRVMLFKNLSNQFSSLRN
uniref:CSON014005 protein n=1 Tax=Culicoides sonorensis TaxID=179676 RepID=A0A336MDD5_CULSO